MLEVRTIEKKDIPNIVKYWTNSNDSHLLKMGVDLSKKPSPTNLKKMIEQQIETPLNKKSSYALIWFLDHTPIGHCNVNKIKYNEEAFMHLHLWHSSNREKGLGTKLVKLSLSHFFNDLKLKQLLCEPYALNPAPNKTLKTIGFTLIKKYITIPGSLNFEQPVKLWRLTKLEFESL